MNQLILGLVFLTVVFLTYVFYYVIFSKKDLILSRLQENVGTGKQDGSELNDSRLTIREQVDGTISFFINLVFNKKYLLKRRKKLAQASIMMKAEEFLGISILTGLMTGGIAYWMNRAFIIALLGFMIGFKLPDLILDFLKNKRLKNLNEQLPEALSILANGLRAGYSFIQSMDVASKELEGPIAEEFAKSIRDNSIGKPIEDAMLEMSERTNNDDMDLFVTALIIQRQVGGNLAEILDTISETIRERVRVTGEIRTLTAEGKLSAIVIAILPIAISIVIGFLNPQYISTLITTDIGRIMVLVSIIMEIIGIFLLKKIVTINI